MYATARYMYRGSRQTAMVFGMGRVPFSCLVLAASCSAVDISTYRVRLKRPLGIGFEEIAAGEPKGRCLA